MHWWTPAGATIAFLLASGTGTARGLCAGDCNGDGLVGVDEVVRSVTLALGTNQYRVCPPGDVNGDRSVTVDELLQAVGSTLDGCPATTSIHRAAELSTPAGPRGLAHGVLPNGRRVEPAGTQIATETLPLNVVLTADGRFLLVTNAGYGDEDNEQFVQVIDTQTLAVTSKVAAPQFLGLAVTADGERVFVGTDVDAGPDRIESLRLHAGILTRDATALVALPDATFPSGLAVSRNGGQLFALGMRSNAFYSIDLASGAVSTADTAIGNLPYAIALSPDGTRAYISSWGWNNGNPRDLVPAPLPAAEPNKEQRTSVAVLDVSDPSTPRLLRYVRIAPRYRIDNRALVGASHPSALALSPDGQLLYVTATNVDLLEVIDTTTFATVAEIDLNIFEDGPGPRKLQGLYPNALAVSPDGRRVYVADAGINAVQVVDIDPTARTFVPAGFIPTGWYPSALALSADGTRLYVANGKGTGVGPNGGPTFDALGSDTYYIAQLLKGSVSVIDAVDMYDLQPGTAAVIANNGLTATALQWVDGEPGIDEIQRGHPVPIEFGSGPSDQIKYVVFILKENRTYDQVFGELPGGDGDPSLAFFAAVTPNQQALAREFAVGDNFYNDAEVSTPGHEWTDQANCNDFTEKMWPQNYDRNLPSAVLEQGLEGFAKGGYVFQALERQGITYRVYGETFALLSRFAAGIDGGGVGSIALPIGDAFHGFPTSEQIFSLVNGQIDVLEQQGVNVGILRTVVWPNLNLDFPLNIVAERTDVERAAIIKAELDGFAAQGELPSYLHIWLPNDHTFGARPGDPTPRSAVADNDAGLGLIVEALTHSPFWPHMAIFVTEDDAQDGQDHVSAHRTISLVISPYVKRGYVSHVHHSNVSMTKTMSLLLGAEPLSQFDRYATDMRDYFAVTPDFTPYAARPRTIPPEINPTAQAAPNAYLRRAAEMSADLDLDWFDAAGANLSRVIALVHAGQALEASRARTIDAALIALAILLGVAALRYGRRISSRATASSP